MNIKFTGKFKSLRTFEWNEIPKLAIITGLNGAGKSQILELIYEFMINQFKTKGGMGATNAIDLQIIGENFEAPEVIYLKGEWQLYESATIDLAKVQTDSLATLAQLKQGWHELQRIMQSDLKQFKRLKDVQDYFQSKGIQPDGIPLEEFRIQMEKSKIADEKDIVQKVSEFFYHYRLNFLDLKVREKSDEQIFAEIGFEPWRILRDIIKEANLPFSFEDPGSMGIRDSYKLVIKKTTTNEIVKFNDLSSGERVLFSLAFLMFNSEKVEVYPRLLLLDEPDAHLHPSMTAQLLNVLKNVLVDKYGVQVIITTHSPSTIAISPEQSIFYMDPVVGYPKPMDKDQAIKSLLSGIPNLYVKYADRRQVFVESDNDVSFYDQLYKRLYNYLNPDVNLYFISSGDSATDKNGQPKSNCDQVIKISTLLKNAGNERVYGIIDFDEGKNKPTENILVLGEGNRYSIENYIFDPLLVGMLMLREKYVTSAEAGVPDLSYNDASTHSKENFQKLVNYVIDKLSLETKIKESDRRDCEIVNGIKLDIPVWYLMHQGHDLETLLIKVFPKLNELKKNKEEKLKLAVIEKVVDDFPKLISKDIVETLSQIQL